MAFNLSDYETVEDRLAKFIKDYPDFRIETQLVAHTPSRFIVQAWAYRTFADSVPFSSGLAFEDIADRGVNATSALENAETSAIGRCLANAGYATKGKRPSREEMSKAQAAEFNKKNQIPNNYTKSKPDPIQVQNPDDEWTIKKVEEPKPVDIAEAFGGTEEIPHCKHGEMTKREGVSAKSGKPYMGYTCSGYLATGGDPQCPAIWYELTPSGKWKPQEKK